jgi:hypothetical protein
MPPSAVKGGVAQRAVRPPVLATRTFFTDREQQTIAKANGEVWVGQDRTPLVVRLQERASPWAAVGASFGSILVAKAPEESLSSVLADLLGPSPLKFGGRLVQKAGPVQRPPPVAPGLLENALGPTQVAPDSWATRTKAFYAGGPHPGRDLFEEEAPASEESSLRPPTEPPKRKATLFDPK